MRNELKKLVFPGILLLLVVISFLGYQVLFIYFVDGDSFWHVANGQAILNGGKIMKEAIDTFPNQHLPYMIHETGFEILVALSYGIMGWKGTYLVNFVALLLLIWGLYRLAQISREQMGFEKGKGWIFLFICLYLLYILPFHFTIKPMFFSLWILVWFVVWLRRFEQKPTYKKAIILGLLSITLSNFHGAMWLMIFVFTVMNLIESVVLKKITLKHFIMIGLVVVGGLLNVGGIKSIAYPLEILGQQNSINEFRSLSFLSKPMLLVELLVLIWCTLPFWKTKKIFNQLFALGFFVLGVMNERYHFYLLVFLPYFLAIEIHKIPYIRNYLNKIDIVFTKKIAIGSICIGIIGNLFYWSIYPVDIRQDIYPVQEMQFIKHDYKGSGRPKVFANYVESAYAMLEGANIFADGRSDPFFSKDSIGINGWDAFDMQYNAFYQGFMLDVVNYSNPNYVIMPKIQDAVNNGSLLIIHLKEEEKEMNQKYGKPVFQGDYGFVWKVNNKK